MIKFRQKEFGIREGSYTGPKDYENSTSTLTMMAKGAGYGALAGAVIGKIAGIKNEDTGLLSGALEGAKYGALSGIVAKIFMSYLHNPMKSIKYQEVDKLLRREFGIYRLSGITVGDSISKRATVDEKFGFNDRNVTDYKVTFCISDNKITMYTLGMTDKELDKTDSVLDYYCKKYTGMNYSSVCINEKVNSYAVIITFTNYPVISNFIMELSNTLETKINLIDNDILAKRITEREEESEEEDSRNFSIAGINVNKNDILDILSKSTRKTLSLLRHGLSLKESLCHFITSIIISTVENLNEKELAKKNIPVPRFMFSNDYLLKALKDLHYIDGFHFTHGEKGSDVNISLVHGIFLVTVKKGDLSKKIDEDFWNKTKGKVKRSEINGEIITYTYSLDSKSEFNTYLSYLIKTGIKFNIFEP